MYDFDHDHYLLNVRHFDENSADWREGIYFSLDLLKKRNEITVMRRI